MSFVLPVDDELALRLLEPHHADEVFAVIDANREHIGRWMPWVAVTRSAQDTRAFAQRALHELADHKQLAMIVLERGRVVGGTGWTDWKQARHCENVEFASADIGYWLAADAQGRGIMTRSVRALVRHAFHDRGLHRLTIRCEPANEQSGAIPRRLGFRHEGTMRRIARWNDRWIDHELFALLADEWDDR
ncbi:MAG: GNAT family N-acetyltransferase [Phycisphaeraceae bacterium]